MDNFNLVTEVQELRKIVGSFRRFTFIESRACKECPDLYKTHLCFTVLTVDGRSLSFKTREEAEAVWSESWRINKDSAKYYSELSKLQ